MLTTRLRTHEFTLNADRALVKKDMKKSPVLTLMTVSAAVILLVLLHLVQDESHCSYLHTCPEGDFICRSGDCVSSHFKCDGEIDCPGGEDENGCEFLSIFVPSAIAPQIACRDHMFQCRHGPCIARAYLCDGEQDCPLGEDEQNCTRAGESPTRKDETAECDPGMVMCADHTACFPKHWICDGEADCLDGSDESDCAMSVENFLAESISELCHPGEHRCNGGEVECTDHE
ncbi:Low-density lipoprotein receptor domain class A [Teladorsagia circumcincta]|uniref:Low-density lipoprotein receptor domain class A n=1 Tax=Teladorsagia circumcincta TaxID=45464 RepID=A0A2G9UVI8_TELCI|nr:Low-density lipoprotein receptor domain class A [Teladorsagia circumcincta]